MQKSITQGLQSDPMREKEQSACWDVVVLGAGGAGMMCAATAARRGKRVLLIDHAEKLGKKILISGGGRCNFTNVNASPKNYASENEHFCKSALARFTPSDFLALIEKHKVPYYEKKLGQLFCSDSAMRIVNLLVDECRESGVEFLLGVNIKSVSQEEQEEDKQKKFSIVFSRQSASNDFIRISCEKLVVATGGLSMPKIGATDFGHTLARQFGLRVTRLDPALVMLTMPSDFQKRFGALSGISVDSQVSAGQHSFRENILFTHSGLSGPAILQASLQWKGGEAIVVNLLPEKNAGEWLLQKKKEGSKKEVKALVGEILSSRLTEALQEEFLFPLGAVQQVADQSLREVGDKLNAWRLFPTGTGGYGRAEVTRGGVHTDELSSKTMESKKVSGLYFIGEVVDMAGWLGGYNFQWAWASGHAAGESL